MSENFIMIKQARVSFPHLFSRPVINGEEGKCGATLMLDPNQQASAIQQIKLQISTLIRERFKGRKISGDKICLRNGEDKGRPEYEGYQVLTANNKSKPLVISSNGKDLISNEEDCPIYAGCLVNAKIRLWAQDNHYGKRINAELIAIQFAADGDPLDSAHISVTEAIEGFDAILEEAGDFLTA